MESRPVVNQRLELQTAHLCTTTTNRHCVRRHSCHPRPRTLDIMLYYGLTLFAIPSTRIQRRYDRAIKTAIN